ncbi:MAG TPA: glycosyltransferase family 4 protein [Caulobacteraceae bacterium]|jgi:glycosyltransferase involved in cell wall biosynthesis
MTGLVGRRRPDQTLRIAWGSPLNQASAIGRVSVDVTNALIERGHEVSLIATEHPRLASLPRRPVKAECVHWSEVDLDGLAEDFDLVVVNVGDNFNYHAGIFPLLDHAGCLGIFHDFYLYNLFQGWLQDLAPSRTDGWRRAKQVSEVTAVYGQPLAGLASQADAGLLPIETIAARMPMTEWAARRCSGALAHAHFYLDRLIAACPGPAAAGPLPVSGRGVAPLAPREGDKITLLTVGVMNANKCAAEAIRAIGASPLLAGRLDYRLVGPIEAAEAERLKALAQSIGYSGLSIMGPVDEATLNGQLEAADIICCLRRPVLEGASGSAVEALLAGRPVIVADAGFYGELPDDMVFKVPAGIDAGALAAQLERLCENEVLRRTAGAKARAWAEARYSTTAYLDVLEPLMSATIEADPVLSVGRRLGAEFARLGLGGLDPAVRRVDGSLAGLFAARS